MARRIRAKLLMKDRYSACGELDGFVNDGHVHVWLQNPESKKVVYLTKGDDDPQINAFIDKGWNIIYRPD